MLQNIKSGMKLYFDEQTRKIHYKRPIAEDKNITDSQTITEDADIYNLLPYVIDQLQQMDRLSDFVSLLHAIKNGYILKNIAFHLLLDVSNFYSKTSISSMRYSKESFSFWLTVHKLFKQRGINFFRGYKAESFGKEGCVKPSECAINFIVPSDKVLSRESAAYRSDVSKPGLMEISLDAFSAQHEGEDVKLSLDGKRIAIGFGELGEEDLGGLEAKPTLIERQERHGKEMQDITTAQQIFTKHSEAGRESIKNVNGCDKDILKSGLLTSITHLSHRVQELRELVVKKKIALLNLKKRVDGDWTQSKLAPAISFLHTKIIISQSSVQDLLTSIDKLGYAVACLNGSEQHYILGSKSPLHLESQQNYICLRELGVPDECNGDKEDIMPNTTKQRTQQWHSLRDKSRMTGSTMFQALGCASLKDQQSHYDKVFKGKLQKVSPELQALFDHGNANEINAVATLTGKILPVYFPDLVYREDGCNIIPLNDSYAVISGDGSGIDTDNSTKMTFEFKCPKPNKERVTDQHYSLPVRYTTQVLAQMFAKKCEHLAYICYTPESSTFIQGTFDPTVWKEVWDLATELYTSEAPRPSKKHTKTKMLLSSLQSYSTSCQFVAEFPSLIGIPCRCGNAENPSGVYGYHSDQIDANIQAMSMDDAVIMTKGSTKALEDAYQVMRKPAKEVLVTMISDLNRMSSEFSGYAVPIQYGLSGFSLSMDVARAFIHQAVEACYMRKMFVKVVAFDGQFVEISVTDNTGKPLTILQFMKKFWNDVTKLDRNTKLDSLLTSNKVVASPANIARIIYRTKETNKKKSGEGVNGSDLSENYLIEHLPSEVVSQMDEDIFQLVRDAGKAMQKKYGQPAETRLDDEAEREDSHAKTPNYEEALIAVLLATTTKNADKWRSCTLDEFRAMFDTAECIRESFTVSELRNILSLTHDSKAVSKMVKWQLVNEVSKTYGNGSEVQNSNQKSPRSLAQLVIKSIKSWPVSAINVAYAQLHFTDAFNAWDASNVFQGGAILLTDHGKYVCLPQWYAQPSMVDNQPIQFIIDAHHLFANNRAKCCSTGMAAMSISPKAWWDVAENSKENETGLSLEIAKELRDRQSNAFAQTTFSEKVEMEMRKNGNTAEADWCQTIRNWYRAMDEAGITPEQRLDWMLNMRSFLLSFLKIGHFPPPGQYVADMTSTQFEGFLCNIDRRIQLYNMTVKRCYNQRTVNSLDSENFFGAFQVSIA